MAIQTAPTRSAKVEKKPPIRIGVPTAPRVLVNLNGTTLSGTGVRPAHPHVKIRVPMKRG